MTKQNAGGPVEPDSVGLPAFSCNKNAIMSTRQAERPPAREKRTTRKRNVFRALEGNRVKMLTATSNRIIPAFAARGTLVSIRDFEEGG